MQINMNFLENCLHNILLRFILFLLFSLLAFISNNQWTSFFFHLSFQISTSSSSTLYSYFLPPSVFPPPKQHQRSLHNKHPLLPAREIKIREIWHKLWLFHHPSSISTIFHTGSQIKVTILKIKILQLQNWIIDLLELSIWFFWRRAGFSTFSFLNLVCHDNHTRLISSLFYKLFSLPSSSKYYWRSLCTFFGRFSSI